jgi:NAD(P)-dependent dehydrogenase (short-subunit alcohol dehydrogenase family)
VCWRTWDVNLGGLFNGTRIRPMPFPAPACLAGLCAIINVGSSGALSARPGGASYRSSKLDALRRTESLQVEHGSKDCQYFASIRAR